MALGSGTYERGILTVSTCDVSKMRECKKRIEIVKVHDAIHVIKALNHNIILLPTNGQFFFGVLHVFSVNVCIALNLKHHLTP
jgi:hypothetical protein